MTVTLESPGGIVKDALEIGAEIRIRNYATMVSADAGCYSACALIWVAGARRYMDPTSKIGFHAVYREEAGELRESGMGNAEVGSFMTHLGLRVKAIRYFTFAGPKDFLLLSPDMARNDAEAICEAIGRPSMRFVPPKSSEQLAIQAVHRIRRRLVADRVRLVNQIRGLLAEHGVVIARDISRLRRALAQIAGSSDDGLNELVRVLVREVQVELTALDKRIVSYDRRIRELYRASEVCQRIGEIEGIGPVTTTALVAAVGDRTCFKNGQQSAAWLGLVPRQRSSGGRARLFGISKRGDRYLRTLIIHGARCAR